MKKFLAAAAMASAVIATPASAATLILGGSNANVTSVIRHDAGLTLTFTAGQFSIDPNSLTALSQLTMNRKVSITAPGLGVDGGVSAPQIDTNTANKREALVVTGSSDFSIEKLKLSYIDNNDTLQVYGIGAGGVLTSLGFDGTIKTGLDGAASFVNSAANSGTTWLTLLDPTSRYSGYVFTTRVGGDVLFGGDLGQGYRVDQIVAGVPEPATWAMLIAGFGMVGFSARRRRIGAVSA
ncbi:PEPxxWA-CTERM sorting domain-containing protein [Sandaracinobacteroides hominis]|uniref:PEPxxWA-CTERM sorting domain-containing protein n=1 Tax=Sandaracinobacteroides hominis TaxID=2780086 RepID=UPI001F2090E3|nr:PEPxxWA-CTERM sorting domain-containing protein [Sandaracinobacteroides hominis]